MMNSESFVTLRGLIYSKALLLKMQLGMQGVNSFITNALPGETFVELQLAESDAALARQLLLDMQFVAGEGKEAIVKQLRRVRRLLVPVDFSARSIKAAHYALELARSLKAEVRLLHVWFSSAGDSFIFNEMYAFQTDLGPVMREMEQKAMDQLNTLTELLEGRIRAERMKGVKVSADLVRGSAVEAILSIAGDYQPGLIVMGTRGKNHDSFRLLGSTTSQLIERSLVPVLAVPEAYDITKFIAPHKALYITHFGKEDLLAMHRLLSFVKPFKTKIFCLHIQSDTDPSLDRIRMKQMKESFLSSHMPSGFECGLIETPDPVEGLEAFVEEKQIDVIALLHRKRNLLENLFAPSLTKRLLYQTHLPLLVFREGNG